MDYSTGNRRRFIAQNAKRFGLGTNKQWSLKRIAMAVGEAFDRKPPSAATIKNDLHLFENEGQEQFEYSEEAKRLLEPDNFAEWRETMFRAPGNKPYLTPKHQLAWFNLIRVLALKEAPPKWIIDYLKLEEALPEDIDLFEWVENPDTMLSLFLLAPPRHGKSDLAAHVIIWLICRNPDIRILWCGGKSDISSLTTAFVKAELESNEKLIEYYGPFENDGNWSDTEFVVATRKTRMRSPTLKAISKGTTILSLDADFIFVDDIFDQKSSESPTQVQKDVRWVKSQLMTRREPWTPLFGIGSHQPVPQGDAYTYMDNEHDNEIYFVKQKVHEYEKCLPREEGMTEADRHGSHCMLWPEVRNFAYLESFRKSLGDVHFEVCYNQDDKQAKLEYFREKVVRGEYPYPIQDPETGLWREFDHYEQKPGVLDRRRQFTFLVKTCCAGAPLRTVIGFDPAASKAKTASESALVVLQGCTKCKRRYLVDYWHQRQSPEKHPGTIERYAQLYRPDRVRIEINAYQLALARDKELNRAAKEVPFIIDEWHTGDKKWDTDMGIPLLSRHMEQGRFSVPYELPQDRDKGEALLAQLVRYPSEPNDLVMALWLADLSLQKQLDAYSVVSTGQWDRRAPAYLRKQQVVIPLGY